MVILKDIRTKVGSPNISSESMKQRYIATSERLQGSAGQINY